MTTKWLVIGISGVTCGGKTTIANELNKIFPGSRVVSQDDYFLPVEDPRHTWIKHLNHINFDILTSLDMEKMRLDVQEILGDRTPLSGTSLNGKSHDNFNVSLGELQKFVAKLASQQQVKILILEGFCIFNYAPVEKVCNLKYFVTLNREECYERRVKRVYEPPDCPGYFEDCVWPEYLNQYEDVKENVDNVKYFSEMTPEPVKEILFDVMQVLNS